jgi:hypothetical protein
MHQSPQKPLAGRRDKYFDLELADSQAERRMSRDTQPKARKFPLREESPREERWNKQFPGK